jgi:hypothetical protein
MSRRSDRENVPRSEYQRRVNAMLAASYQENERGWRIPNTVLDGWDELNHAIYALRCVLIWSRLPSRNQAIKPLFNADFTINRSELHRGMDAARLESDMRSFHFHIARARQCPTATLP